MSRLITGAVLTVGGFVLFHFDYRMTLYVLVNLASIYDSLHLAFSTGNYLLADLLFKVMTIYYKYLMIIYPSYKETLVMIVVITQLSDICQYFSGRYLGKISIGSISPNKTYEGYVGGYLATILLLFNFYSLTDLTTIYLLGIMSGLFSSSLKRFFHIKDYSNLLGSHGGWLDRIDSIILPSICYSFGYWK